MSNTPEEVDGGEEVAGTEVVRLVLGDDSIIYTTLDLIEPDPSFWGGVLADLVRNVAEALADRGGGDPEAVLDEIRAAMEETLRDGPEADGE